MVDSSSRSSSSSNDNNNNNNNNNNIIIIIIIIIIMIINNTDHKVYLCTYKQKISRKLFSGAKKWKKTTFGLPVRSCVSFWTLGSTSGWT